MTRGLGVALVALALLAAVSAPVVAPNKVDAHFAGLLNVPPTVVRVTGEDRAWHAPFFYRGRRGKKRARSGRESEAADGEKRQG